MSTEKVVRNTLQYINTCHNDPTVGLKFVQKHAIATSYSMSHSTEEIKKQCCSLDDYIHSIGTTISELTQITDMLPKVQAYNQSNTTHNLH